MQGKTLLVAVVLALSACGGAAGERAPVRTIGTMGPVTPAATSPAEALRRAGLTLPPEATDVRLEQVEGVWADEAYRVTFTLPRADVTRFCSGGGLPGEGLVVAVTQYDQQMLGSATPTSDTVGCANIKPTDPRWMRSVLATPQDPSQVTVAVWFTRR